MQERIRKLSNNAESLRWQIAFVVICVVVSRLLILAGFEVWKERTAFEGSFFEAFSRFDTTWYQSIIGGGYQTEPTVGDRHDAANWAFFPLFPMMIRCLHFFIPVEYDLLGFWANSVLFGGALLLAFRYILFTRWDKVQAVVFVLLLSFGMYNFYFSTLYTEALFLFLLVLFFYSMEKKKYICMGMAGALASATRNMGIMCVFAVAAHYLTDYMKNNKFRVKTLITNLFSNPPLLLGTVLIPAGLFSYMLYLYCLTGIRWHLFIFRERGEEVTCRIRFV